MTYPKLFLVLYPLAHRNWIVILMLSISRVRLCKRRKEKKPFILNDTALLVINYGFRLGSIFLIFRFHFQLRYTSQLRYVFRLHNIFKWRYIFQLRNILLLRNIFQNVWLYSGWSVGSNKLRSSF